VRRSLAPALTLAGLLALSIAAALFLYLNGRTRDRARFHRAARGATDRIEAQLDGYATVLRGCAALLAAMPEAGADAFHDYASRLDLPTHYPGVQGVGYARRVRPAEVAAVESELSARGFEGLRIWPERDAGDRTAIVMLEPLDRRNRAAIGYDMSTEPVRREAMMRARDSGQAAISGKVTLVQEIDPQRQNGFLLYVPVYRGGGVPDTLEGRRAALIGWTYAPFRSDDLFLGIFRDDPEVLVDIQIYDGPRADPALLLHDRPVRPASAAMAEVDRLLFGGREWTLVFSALPALATGSLAAPGLTLLAGIILSGAIFLLSEREARARRGAESALQGLQRSLQEQRRYEERLREEGRVNSILRRLGISLAAELDPDRLAQLICDEATSLTAADFGAMFDAGPEVRLLASSGAERPAAETLAWLARSCKPQGPVRIDDARVAGAAPPGGAERFRSVLTVPITLRTGHMLGALAFTHPEAAHFTEQHERLGAGIAAQASIALDNARLLRDLQDADRRKDEFLAVLGHELRNPLAPVVTALEVMKRDRSSADRQLAIVERQARHMVRIVDDLLDVSRISRGKIELRKHRLAVREALARAADAVLAQARSRGQKLQVRFPARPLLIDADPVRLEQILGNLLTNAIKYTPQGGEVELSAAADGETLEIRVRDTGIGISRESLRLLFEPFVQVAGAKDYATGGLGIGLALVRGLVALHGGSVHAESLGPGKGSTFVVRLPGVVEGVTPVEVHPPARAALPGRVLVVDDNVDAAMTLSEAVRFDGHDVRVAHDGPSALQEAAAFSPEVVLLDIGLPGMDGYEVVRRLRELPQTHGALIVALTGFGQDSDRRRAIAAGFDDHLVKPVDLDTVTAVLRRRLGAA
jgi:signal transduction histidine kinase/CHASE1-domain containing sensor protein/CheY-like chemotaxis protein